MKNILIITLAAILMLTVFGGAVQAQPAAPLLQAPAQREVVSEGSVTFSWNAVSGATNYRLRIVKLTPGARPQVVFNRNVRNVTGHTVPAAIFDGSGTVYRWQVRAGNALGLSPWSGHRFFSAGELGVPEPLSPEVGEYVFGEEVPFSWEPVENALRYRLMVVDIDNGGFFFNRVVGNITEYTATGFPNDGTRYRWRVRAINRVGAGPLSNPVQFFSGEDVSSAIYVPADYGTIQAAINAAVDGTTIIVSPGTYIERINFIGKQITVRSENPSNLQIVNSTIIDGSSQGASDPGGSVVTFSNGESRSSVLSGLTITGGSALSGGGIYIFNANPTLANNLIRLNVAEDAGGAIYISGGRPDEWESPLIRKNRIVDNTASTGGGITVVGRTSGPVIKDNTIEKNVATSSGGAITVTGHGSAIIRSNTIRENEASTGGGVAIFELGSSALMEHNNLYDNVAYITGGGISISDRGFANISDNTIRENSSQWRGGGIYAWGSTAGPYPYIARNDIIDNSAVEEGGGIWLGPHFGYQTVFTASIEENVIKSNSAANGAGIYVFLLSSPVIADNTIEDNTAAISGGGIMVSGSTPQIRSNVFRNNRSEGGSGGGINVAKLPSGMNEYFSAPVIDDNTFTSNRAEHRGGAIFVEAMNEILDTWQHPWSGINIPSGGDSTNTYDGNTHGFGIEGQDVYFE